MMKVQCLGLAWCGLAALACGHACAGEPTAQERAAALVKQLRDPDEKVRGEAIVQLRLLARRVDVSGGQRLRRGKEFEPQVKGLVPALIEAAGDAAEANRVTALYALADTLEPAAHQALRDRLKDQSEAVRFQAACLLTEFQDASGLPEMKKALKRLRETDNDVRLFDVERLLASFQRITGKSFGPIPGNPVIMSDSRAAAAARDRYRELLETWSAWWDWTPGASKAQGL
jgi:HEAT repeat protein